MASRINTRVLLIVFIVAGTVIGGVAGVWYFKVRGDASRIAARAEESFAQGDYRRARRFFGRAVGKEPADAHYLSRLEAALLAIQPETADEAAELYRAFISIRAHDATHNPSDPDKHIALLDEIHMAARRSGMPAYYELLQDSAEEMWVRIPAGSPKRVHAKFFLGASRAAPHVQDRLTSEEVGEGIADLREFVDAMPGDGRGWGTLIRAQLARAERLHTTGDNTPAAAQLDEARATLAEAREKAGDHPEVLVGAIRIALYESVVQDQTIDEETLRRDADELVALVQETDQSWIVSQAAEVLDRLRYLEGVPDPLTVVDEYLADHPDAHDHLLIRARLQFFMGEIDEAELTAQEIIDANLLHVGYVSQLQFELKRRAASLILDIKSRRWELAEPHEKSLAIEQMRAARDVLESIVKSPDDDPLLLRANGKIAFAREDYSGAAAYFNRLLSLGADLDFETLMYAAISLEQRGEIGAAADRIAEAISVRPTSVPAHIHGARLRVRAGRYEDGLKLVEAALALEPENETAVRMKAQIAQLIEGTLGDDDPVRVALNAAQRDVTAGEFDRARATLVAARTQNPDNLPLLNALIRVEMAAGRTDVARTLLDEGLERAPDSRTFLTLDAFMDNPDPLMRIKQYVEDLVDDEGERAVEILHSYRQLEMSKRAEADALEQQGDTAAAEEARELARRAREAIAPYLAVAAEQAAEHPRYVEFRFLEAVLAQDWGEVEQVVRLAARLDSDLAGGALFEGRYQAARERPEEAIRAFRLATERVPYSATAWRLLGMTYQHVGNLNDALVAYERSYRNNPNDPDTLGRYGGLLHRMGNKQRALLVFREGHRMAPDNEFVRDAWLTLEAEIGDPAVSLMQRRLRYASNPEDRRNAAALAGVLGRTVPIRELLLDENGEELYSTERWGRLSLRGESGQLAILEEARRQWHAEADRILADLAAPEDRDLAWHMLQSDLYRVRGRYDDGEKLLLDFVAAGKTDKEKFDALLALGMYRSTARRVDEALSAMEEARAHQDPVRRTADLALAEMLFRYERHAEALPHFQSVLDANPSDKVRLQVAECQVKLEQFAEARRNLEAVEASAGVTPMTQLLRAALVDSELDVLWNEDRLTEADAKLVELESVLRIAEQLSPSDPVPHVLRAGSLFKKYQKTGDAILLEDALRSLGRADEVRLGYARTSLMRVAIFRAQGNERAALSELTDLVSRRPELDRARRLLVNVLARSGRRDTAREVIQEAIDRAPDSAPWIIALGDLHYADMEEKAARLATLDPESNTARALRNEITRLQDRIDEQYAAALELAPSEQLLVKRTGVLLSANPPKYTEVLEALDRHRELVGDSPALRVVYSLGLDATGRRKTAIAQMRVAYADLRVLIAEGKAAPTTISTWYKGMLEIYGAAQIREIEALALELAENGELDAYETYALGDLWRLAGPDGRSRGVELFVEARAKAPPEDVAFLNEIDSDLGIMYILMERYAEARVAFEHVLEREPDDPEVLNNLAYLLAEKLDDPNSALPHAQRAAELMPETSSVIDTLGWILFRLDRLEEAEAALRRSEEIELSAANQYHLAAVMAAQGQYDRARVRLRQAAELNPDRDTLAEINRLSDDIRTKQ
jgi:tetratricopeptide (TPR) repeat protein